MDVLGCNLSLMSQAASCGQELLAVGLADAHLTVGNVERDDVSVSLAIVHSFVYGGLLSVEYFDGADRFVERQV